MGVTIWSGLIYRFANKRLNFISPPYLKVDGYPQESLILSCLTLIAATFHTR